MHTSDHLKSFKGHMLRAGYVIPTKEMRLKKLPQEAQINEGEKEDVYTEASFFKGLREPCITDIVSI